jgi:hypothetical protein
MTNDHAATTGTTRRHLLQLLGLAGAAGATIAVPTAAEAMPKHKQKGVVVYRLSTRGTSRCKACARHHTRLAFLTHAIANAHRAHPGCNCPITTQRLSPRSFKQLFAKNASGVAELTTDPATRDRRA